MHKVLRIGIWALAIFVVLVAGLFAYLRSADLSVYEDQIEGFISKGIGHQVNIDGLFELRVAGITRLTADEISIRNPDWQSEPTILSVAHLAVSVHLWSLFDRGPIRVEDMTVEGVRLHLERDTDGNANWDNGRPKPEQASTGTFDRNLVAFRTLNLSDVVVDYLDPNRVRPINLNLSTLSIAPDDDNVLDLDLRAELNEIPLSADGKLGPWTNLIDGKNISIDLDVTLGENELLFDGQIADLPRLEGVQAQLGLRGPSIDRLITTLGLPPFASGEFELNGAVAAQGDGNQVSLNGNLGDITIYAEGSVDRFLDPGRARFEYRFAGPDAKYVAEVFGLKNVMPAPFNVSGNFSLDDARYGFANTRAEFATGVVTVDGWVDVSNAIPDLDVSVNASGPDLSALGALSGVQGIPADAFSLSGRVRKNAAAWRFDDVNFQAGEIRLGIKGELDENNAADDQIDISASGPDMSFLQAMTGLQGVPARPFEVSVRLTPHRDGVRLNNALGRFGDHRLEIDGVLGKGNLASGTDLQIRASGPELHNIALLSGIPYLPTGPFEFESRAIIDDGVLTLQNATASVTGIDGSTSGTIGLQPMGQQIDLQVSAGGPDLAKLANLDVLQKFAGERFEISGRIGRDAERFSLRQVNAAVGTLRATIDGQFTSDLGRADLRTNIEAPDSEILASLSGLGDFPQGPVSLGGRIVKVNTDLEFSDTQFHIGEFSFTADGTVSTSPRRNRSDLRFSFSGPDMHLLGLPFGIRQLPQKSFQVSGEVNGIPEGFAIENLVAKVGDNDVVADFTTDLRDKPEITGKISSTYIDLDSPMLQSAEEEQDSKEDVDREFLFSNEPIDNQWLNAANIDIDLRTGRAILNRADVHDIHIHLRLWDGVLLIEPISFREFEGSVDSRFLLETEEDGYRLDWRFSAQNMHVGVPATPQHDRQSLPPVAANVAISGTGRSLHEILASSNGSIDIRRGSGQIRRLMTSQVFGDIVTEVLRTVNPLSKSRDYNNLECAVYRANIKNGLLTIDNIAAQTDRVTLIASGQLNFATEQLDVSLRTKTREGIGVSLGGVANSFLKLGGTLKNPGIEINPASSVTTGGIAVATGGLSLLARGLWDRVSAEADMCKELNAAGN